VSPITSVKDNQFSFLSLPLNITFMKSFHTFRAQTPTWLLDIDVRW
jgi:hypothetical protein